MPPDHPRAASFVLWLFLLLMVVAAHSSPVRPVGLALLINLVFFLFVAHASVLLHETAHAAVAHAVGLRPFMLVAGFGPVIVNRVVGGFFVRLRALPGSGLTLVAAPSARWLRLRLLPTYAAGPLANITVLVVVVAMVEGGVHRLFWANLGFKFEPLSVIFIVNLWITFITLFPAKAKGSQKGRDGATDGLKILSLPFLSAERIGQIVRANTLVEVALLMHRERYAEAAETVEARIAQDPDDVVAKAILAGAWLLMGRHVEARDLCLELLPDPRLTHLRYSLANDVAWADVLIGRADLLPEADRLSAEAIAAAPRNSAVAGTRGSVLVELGRIDEAVPLLQSSFDESERPRSKAYNACYLALAEARRGNAAASKDWIEKAKHLNPRCEFLERLAEYDRESPSSSIARAPSPSSSL